jgi:hypothetical protein
MPIVSPQSPQPHVKDWRCSQQSCGVGFAAKLPRRILSKSSRDAAQPACRRRALPPKLPTRRRLGGKAMTTAADASNPSAAADASKSSVPWWKEPTKEQWLAWVAAWLGWTLDAFDFTMFLLIMVPISQEFHVPLTDVAFVLSVTRCG